AWYAVQTVRQLLSQAKQVEGGLQLPQLSIEDAPLFPYRGMHLDVSRHFFNIEFIKKYIDLIALHKMNYFHWHLSDDQGWRIEIKKYPHLVEIGAYREGTVEGHTLNADSSVDNIKHGGYYTQEEIRDVVAYASERHVTVVPEIDVPGHASALIAAYPEFGCGPETKVKRHFGIFKHVLCSSEETFAFLDDIFSEVAELFPGPYIHIGGDEVVKDHWHNCESCQKLMVEQDLHDLEQLQAYFVNRAEKIVNKYNKQIIGWDEILDGDIHPSATIMTWHGMEGGLKAAEKGHNVIMTPAEFVYFDAYQSTSLDEPLAIHGLTRLRDVYGFQPAPSHLSDVARQKILGGQGNLWTEYISTDEAVEYMVLPRMCALAEVLWSEEHNRDFDSFLERLETFTYHLRMLDYVTSDSHYKPELQANLQHDDQFLVAMEVEQGSVYYTLDGSLPNLHSNLYHEPFTLAEECSVRARTWVDSKKKWYGDCRITTRFHKAIGSDITFANPMEVPWNASSGGILFNGNRATDRIFQHHEWAQFWGEKLDAEIKFPRQTIVSSVSIGVMGLHRQLHKPTEIAVYSGEPDKDWVLVGYMNTEDIDKTNNRVKFDFKPTLMDRLRFVAVNDRHYWSPEKEDMVRAIMSFDEIVIH
ncbi:MAG: family 20 glycosylhydrolase, partial [Gammaproteobacteria bacterium]|nr:family 20 glycosylhydrolase [Gammaproteobacteria bacterium]